MEHVGMGFCVFVYDNYMTGSLVGINPLFPERHPGVMSLGLYFQDMSAEFASSSRLYLILPVMHVRIPEAGS
jgi:hypothetical protein